MNIEFGRVYENIRIKIRTVEGKTIVERELENKQRESVDIDAPSGVYFVEVVNGEGKKVAWRVVRE